MIRTLLFLFLACTLSLMAAGEPRTVTAALENVKDDSATVPVGNIPVGVSGIVIHAYDQTHKAILASVIVTAGDKNSATLKLLPYRGLRQPNLPTIKTKPQNGDMVILGYLYDRALPIVPNQKSLEKAKESFPKLHLIHPDLFAAELAKDKSPLPSKKHFKRICEKMHLGIVMFMFKDGTDFIDCVSWVKVGDAHVTSVDANHFKQPFFNRFEEIPSPFYDWTEYKIGDFDRFYRKMESEK
ncbi:plasminogen-binding N-terminal domain-containing protein [Hydrogenimonas urashimensis]|uniref:plasminogen-binding N-terminal domain-containing protein n=1 Tax=Hydrogenimonas urashimensis TaxID=2740515 RepID=UPI001915C824|nr:plasminogen-binding N-terminal domain-containing protein [Hydrogenimonas urashimensis]